MSEPVRATGRRRTDAMTRMTLGAVIAGFMMASGGVSAQRQPVPKFTTSVDLTSIDASVFDDRGRPVTDLTPADFVIRVDESPRRVVTAEWIPLVTAPGKPALVAPEGYSSNEGATGGRLILLVIDQPNIRFGGTVGIRSAVDTFIDHLQPSDRAAVVGIGPGPSATPFTADRRRLKDAVAHMAGQHQQTLMPHFTIGLAEAMDIRNGMPGALDRVVNRECREGSRLMQGADLDICATEVERDAGQMGADGANAGQSTLSMLRALLTALQAIDAPKTLVLVSEGFLTDNQQASVVALGALAGAARTSIYALKLDDQLFVGAAEQGRAPLSRMDDRAARAEGLDILTSASRGSLFNVMGNGSSAFDRIEAELSGYYLLGIESGPDDRDGKTHPARVEVTRKGLTVRSRRALLVPSAAAASRNPRQAVAKALAAPLPVATLPLRVATFSLQGPEAQKVQILIHADVGTDYSSSRVVTLAYTVSDPDGRVVEGQAATARLPPIMTGVPSALQFSGGASLPPGDYVLKLAVAEGDRVGTVEHPFHAGVTDAGTVRTSDLMAGGPSSVDNDLLQPTIGYRIVFGTVHGYLEAYGPGVSGLKAKYEIASDARGAALFEENVTPRMAGDRRAIFSRQLPVRQLPPGQYVLRVTLSSGTAALEPLVRTFEIAPPAVLMTSASTTGDAALPARDVYLPVSDGMLARDFDRAEVVRDSTVRAFRDRVPVASREAFDQGVLLLSASSFGDAESSFKAAMGTDGDSSAALAYLAATFAAAGHDAEAASAWQTALVDGSDLPQIYDWLAGALMRTGSLAQARGTLEEAVAKWPGDPRFAKPMALVYATFGQGVQAVRLLDRHLAVHSDDVEGLQMGVEWIYQLHLAGAIAHTPAEDVKLARRYAEAYQKARGPQAALVKQWMAFIEGQASR